MFIEEQGIRTGFNSDTYHFKGKRLEASDV